MTPRDVAEQIGTKRQFCRIGIHQCVPVVDVVLRPGFRLHFCAEHAHHADDYQVRTDEDIARDKYAGTDYAHLVSPDHGRVMHESDDRYGR